MTQTKSKSVIGSLALSVLLLLSHSISAHAASPAIDCASIDPDAQTQATWTHCAREARKQAEADLENFRQRYIERLEKFQITLFHAQEQAWRTYALAACEFETSAVQDGSAYSMMLAGCMERKTRAHLLELQTVSECDKELMDCPA